MIGVVGSRSGGRSIEREVCHRDIRNRRLSIVGIENAVAIHVNAHADCALRRDRSKGQRGVAGNIGIERRSGIHLCEMVRLPEIVAKIHPTPHRRADWSSLGNQSNRSLARKRNELGQQASCVGRIGRRQRDLLTDRRMGVVTPVGGIQTCRFIGIAAIHRHHECIHIGVTSLILRTVEGAVLHHAEAAVAACGAVVPKTNSLVKIQPVGGIAILVDTESVGDEGRSAIGFSHMATAAIGLKLLCSECSVARNVDTVIRPWHLHVGGKGIIKVAIRIGRYRDCRKKLPELCNFCVRCRLIGAIQSLKRSLEVLENRSISAPMQKWRLHLVHKRHGQEWPLHRVKADTLRIRDHGVLWIAEVPCKPVCSRIHMAGCARRLPQAGVGMGVVQHRAPRRDRSRSRVIQQRSHCRLGKGTDAEGRYGCVEFVENKSASLRLLQHDAGRTLPDVD